MSAEQLATSTDGRNLSVLSQLSTEMVGLYKELFGRGPTHAKSTWCGEDVLTVVLSDTLTPTERTLLRLGEMHRLRETRMFFQYASVREFCEPVERLTGRTVRAFISGTDIEIEGISVETFVLHPRGSTARSRIDLAVARP
jgi:uncharacterized protein YbcI